MSDLYHVSSSPHVRSKDTTSKIMLYVIMALLPTSLFGIYNFGIRALILILVTIASCVASEWIFNKIVHKKNSIDDLSAVVTGLLLALNLPASLPWWEAVIGGVFAIVIVKMMFGGLGQNFMNPALGARCFLLIAFAADMTNFTVGAYSGATPLAQMRNGEAVNTMSMLIGKTAGTIGVTIASCVASEWIFNKIVHKKNSIDDLSAVVTGLLLALNLPASLPWWEAVIGGVFAIVIVKMMFGGLGQNFMNPALGARCFLLIAFAADMTNFTVGAYSGATPLAQMRNGEAVNTMSMLIGKTAGTIGETSAIAILIGAIFLILMGVIDLRIPASYIITFVVFILLFGGHGFDMNYVTAQLCGGGLMLGAFFMATDYVTSPITPRGQIIFGICCGIFTGLFRCFGANAEGVSFAIILSNLLVPMIEKYTVPNAFGVVKTKPEKEAK